MLNYFYTAIKSRSQRTSFTDNTFQELLIRTTVQGYKHGSVLGDIQ